MSRIKWIVLPNSSAEPLVEPVISKIVPGPAYEDYYKQRMDLEKQKETIATKRKELRGKRDPAAARELQKEERENHTKIARLEMTHPAAPARAMVLLDKTKPHDSPVFIRGDAGKKGPMVPRQFLEVLSGPRRTAFTNGSGRLELALAIVSKSDPLPARVMMNRVWLHHFGEGFVPTPDDLGTMSEAPSHRELLDYLASRFIEEGWSLKKMHRLIMLSSVYQESSANNPRFAQIDPNNRLLWRANIRRLEFEALRDSLLAIGGDLDETMYGRPVDLEKEPFSTRRTLYGFIDRSDVSDMLINFDFPTPDLPTGRRHVTTVPQQALFLMNSPLVIEQAKRLVGLPAFCTCPNDFAKIAFLYEQIYQRLPKSEEVQLGKDFVATAPEPQPEAFQESSVLPVANSDVSREAKVNGKRAGRQHPFHRRAPLSAWEEYAHALLQANETSFVN